MIIKVTKKSNIAVSILLKHERPFNGTPLAETVHVRPTVCSSVYLLINSAGDLINV